MQKESKIHEHPNFVANYEAGRVQLGTGRKTHILGHLLEAGDILHPDDVYSSSNGYWEKCSVPGLKLGEGVAVVWVRPS